MRRLLLATILSLTLAMVVGGLAHAQTKPEFRLGFKSLADQIPNVVGEPLENEHWGANGDSLQRTTTGLMAWRKADNWTAFTDGATTWINGPLGVQSRPNDQRFPWEADGGGQSSGPPPQSRLTMEKLKNAEYDLVEFGKVKLVNGIGQLSPEGQAWFSEESVRFGDLNMDGLADAAVILVFNSGGSGVFRMLVAMLDEQGNPKQVDAAGLGDRVKIERFQVTGDGEIQVRMITQGPDDPMCCPTVQVDEYYRLIAGKLKMSAQ